MEPKYNLYALNIDQYKNNTSKLNQLLPYLDKNRIERLNNTTNPDVRATIICGGYLIKHALSKSFGITDSEIVIDSNGKPFDAKHPNAYFNLSHSESVVIVVTSDVPCGIDIEYINPTTNYESIVSRFFKDNEKATIKSRKDFYDMWTIKESYAKMTGKGIAKTLKNVEIIRDNGNYKASDPFHDTSNVIFKQSNHYEGYSCSICLG
ncbi:MAG: 4'-phosphopantetheinyl transferase superfamily protein [Clostridia bacterium]|nr:4'-phosphopantetheinyl transferase superfamily protein [Clostridia bacterium]